MEKCLIFNFFYLKIFIEHCFETGRWMQLNKEKSLDFDKFYARPRPVEMPPHSTKLMYYSVIHKIKNCRPLISAAQVQGTPCTSGLVRPWFYVHNENRSFVQWLFVFVILNKDFASNCPKNSVKILISMCLQDFN